MSGKVILRTRKITFKGFPTGDIPHELSEYCTTNSTPRGQYVEGVINYDDYSDDLRDRLLDIGLAIEFDTDIDQVLYREPLYPKYEETKVVSHNNGICKECGLLKKISLNGRCEPCLILYLDGMDNIN